MTAPAPAPAPVGPAAEGPPRAAVGDALEVLLVFTRLGLTSFGGPVAHLGYFRTEFVERRGWLGEAAYADLVALCQLLPGPASSKVGFSPGLMRAGYLGGALAWLGFTLPSALLLVLFAYGAGALAAAPLGQGLLHGLKLVAVAIVAQAVWGMARSLCPDRPRAAIGATALGVALLVPAAVGQIGAIVLGAALGLALCRSAAEAVPAPVAAPVSRTVGVTAAAAFALLLALSLAPWGATPAGVAAAIYRSGALVFGGGHVVLPLLSDAVVRPGWVDPPAFLAGYGAAQAAPGPLFAFAAYLGALARPAGGIAGAALGLVAIFAPGLLLQLAVLPFWGALRHRPAVQAAMRGINAAVVGVLGAALYTPVITGAVHGRADVVIATLGFVGLTAGKAPPWLIVLFTAAAGVLMTVAFPA